MKPFSKAETAQFRKNLRAYNRVRNRTKIELVNAAHAAESTGSPQYLWPDGMEDAWFHRKSRDAHFIETCGGFSNHVVILALTDTDWETKESVATWLRNELKLLREAEAK